MQGALFAALVVIAGQSNALGFRVTPDDLPSDLRAADGMVRIWNGRRFDVMRPGVNTGTAANPTAWGPEVSFAHSWRAMHPDERLYIVKSVKGSTGLAADPSALDWSPRSAGELFDQTSQKVAAAQAASGLRVSTILWMQGEQDATDPARAAAYADNLRKLIFAMRVAWGEPGTRVVLGRIGEGALPYAGLVRAAEAEVAARDARAMLVETGGLSRQADGLHLDAAGEMALGSAFYAASSPSRVAGGAP